jgi:hypothetical protein
MNLIQIDCFLKYLFYQQRLKEENKIEDLSEELQNKVKT